MTNIGSYCCETVNKKSLKKIFTKGWVTIEHGNMIIPNDIWCSVSECGYIIILLLFLLSGYNRICLTNSKLIIVTANIEISNDLV